MALKYVALLFFICAAQAQIFGQSSRPVHINPEASTLIVETQDIDQVTKPMAHFAAQISKIRESFHNMVPARFQEYANKGREVINKITENIFKLPQIAAQQNNDLFQHAQECVRDHQNNLIELAQTAQKLLEQSVSELVGDVEADLGPMAEEMEQKTQEAVQTIQKTVQEVQALISEGKLIAAKDRLNAGRNELDDQVTTIVNDAQKMGADYPILAAEAEIMGQHFYDVTSSGATELFKSVQECIKNGKN